MVLFALGLAALLAGVAILVGPLLGVFGRGQADQSALQAWNNGGSGALTGPAKGSAANASHTACGSTSPSDYALVSFGAPAQYHYAGVAGNGTWDLLTSRSMVHYTGTAAPGQQGNSIIAFHREPDYEHIDQLGVGATIMVQDRSCHTYVYKVTGKWDLPPSKVTQLTPTSGYDLTMITCDPWWQDYNRLVWRAELVSPPAQSGGSTSPGSAPSNPTF
jgi:LPXTG-site transpeptidase (sortase) family protein